MPVILKTTSPIAEKEVPPVSPRPREPSSSAKDKYKEVEKTFKPIAGTAIGVGALGLLLGSLKYGATFPAKALKVVGDAFGSIGAIASPFFLVGNEIINFYSRRNGNGERAEIKKIFDTAREGFYRACSAGFTPFVIEPFINPEKFGATGFHKAATIFNIPALFFTTVTWAGGNLQALLAWVLKTKEQTNIWLSNKSDESLIEESNKKIEGYEELYQSFKRMTIIGSIANPVMQGLRQLADTCALFTGKISPGDFFRRPFLGLSRLVSFFVAAPEYYAKGVDSVVRVVKERENLKKGLPGFLRNPLDNFGNWFENKITNENNGLKSIRHYAEIIFHTLSPLSMFSLFTPLLDEPHLEEEAQNKGGASALIDKVLGRTGSIFLSVFNGLYVFFSRAPQSFIQIAYFGKKLIGKISGKETTTEDLNNLRERICNSLVVKGLSDFAENSIKKLVSDFYKVEHDHGYLTYEQIQTNYAFEQAKDTKIYEELCELVKEFKAGKTELNNKINEQIEKIIQEICLPFVGKDALQGKHELTSIEENDIKERLTKKIKQKIGLAKEVEREELQVIGAEFLATYVLKLFDLRSRFKAIDYRSSHHNMTTAYDNDEIRISFEYELLPVLGKCIYGLKNTVNRLQGISVN
ncbi:MAG: hypothetical protein HYY52_03695 [Candidatus Melainabacteria bacterium]|nr:hypothetical protein [Candidatus Melainabacteria bacterium]